MLKQQTAGIAAQRGKRNQHEETPVPPAVEDVAGKYYQHVLPFARRTCKPIEEEYYWQENDELE